MQFSGSFWPTLLLSVALLSDCTTAAKKSKPANAVLLSNVQSLTLRNGLKTSARRVSAIPQLKCVGGSAKGLHDVDILRCENAGSSYDDSNVQWTCRAHLPSEFKLGSTDVICEGYDSPEDPYILKGSCGVEYRLLLTDEGVRKYGQRGDHGEHGGESTAADKFVVVLFWGLFIGVLLWMVYSFFQERAGNRGPTPGGGGGGGGGGWGGGDDNDPPPPYDYQPPRKSPPSDSSSRQPGWRPGFWSGLGLGGLGGYTAGSYNSNRRNDRARGYGRQNFGGYDQGFGGWDRGEGSSRSSRSEPSSSSSSSARYESSGFGGTTRR